MKKRYECPGSCGGTKEVEDWSDNPPNCSEEACEHHGEPLEEKLYCEKCGTSFDPDSNHKCSANYIG